MTKGQPYYECFVFGSSEILETDINIMIMAQVISVPNKGKPSDGMKRDLLPQQPLT